jgi:hemerythrin-like domain-containing protein
MDKNELFPPAAPDFSDPLGLLRACHENVFRHCDMVEKLAAHVANTGLDQEAHQAAAQIHRYFSVAARQHHEDEEQDLFPRLARQSLKLAELIHGLKQEHQQLDALWAELEPLLAKPAGIEDAAAFSGLAKRFAEAYRNHARKENSELLEMAQHIFSGDELKLIGQAMAERRGVKHPF